MKVVSIIKILTFAGVFFVSCGLNKEDETIKKPDNGLSYFPNENPKSYIPGEDTTVVTKIKDGTYVADVYYYNTTTGANVTYSTKVRVENSMLRVIYWPNGVWLSSQYFKPQKIQADGSCIISNLDAGYENRVQIFNLEYE